MTLGDGIRRDIAKVNKEERDLYIDAVIQLNQKFFSPNGSRSDFPAGHVSYWFKVDEIHQRLTCPSLSAIFAVAS